MRSQLLDWLLDSNANYASVDTEQDLEAAQKVAERQKKGLKHLERLRKEMLRENWEPNDDWWGSAID